MKASGPAFGLLLFLSGCVALNEGIDTTGMTRTRTVRDEKGDIRTTREPYRAERKGSEAEEPIFRPLDLAAPVPPAAAVVVPPATVNEGPVLREREVLAAETTLREGPSPLTVSAGFSGLSLWTKLTTNFQSASLPSLRWDPSPRLGARGVEVSFAKGPDDDVDEWRFSLVNGYVWSDGVKNSQTDGAFFARETVSLRAYWIEGDAKYYLKDWFFGSAGLMGSVYSIRSAIDTNAPTFEYEGFSGTRLFWALAVGGGLSTPVKYPCSAYLAVRAWMPMPLFGLEPLENVATQIGAGVAYRFH